MKLKLGRLVGFALPWVLVAKWGTHAAAAADLSLEDILNLKVTVASRKAQVTREAPGIVSVITAEDIKHLGARDLIDILYMVPGVHFGSDILGQTGLVMRGAWGHEGKILLLWDGMEMNDLFFNNTVFGNHYPVDQIQRIEVMRGPGSAVFGGNAELAVINVISKSAEELNGIHASATYGQMAGTYSQRNLSLQYGRTFNTSKVSIQTMIGQGMRSNRDYTDSLGSTINFSNRSNLDPFFFNLGFQRGDFESRLIIDRYRTRDQTGFGKILPNPEPLTFDSYLFGAKYKLAWSDRFKATPFFNFRESRPWRFTNSDLQTTVDPVNYSGLFYDKIGRRITTGLTVDYEPTAGVSLLGGVEYFQDDATSLNPTLNPVVKTDPATGAGLANVQYYNIAAYSQGIFETSLANITAGIRVENHNRFGSSLVPRLAATRNFGSTYIKALASRAFRSPSIETIKINSGVLPERTNTYEFEVGRRISQWSLISLNVFDAMINRPLVYIVDTALPGGEDYVNFDKSGTRGLELQFQTQHDRWSLTTNYSYYRVSTNTVPTYAVDGHPTLMLGAPAHKITLQTGLKLSDQLRLSSSAIYLSERYGYDYDVASASSILKSFDPLLLLNFNLTKSDWIYKNLDLSVGVFNILDQPWTFIQSYRGNPEHSPLPGTSRDFFTRIGYRILF